MAKFLEEKDTNPKYYSDFVGEQLDKQQRQINEANYLNQLYARLAANNPNVPGTVYQNGNVSYNQAVQQQLNDIANNHLFRSPEEAKE